jgi:hypothetical protein
MSKKYDLFGNFLDLQLVDRLTLSFAQIEKIIGSKLPASASKYDAWWSNSAVDGRHNEVWLRRGWTVVEHSFNSRTVKFQRVRPPQISKLSNTTEPSLEHKEIALSDQLTPPSTARIEVGFSIDWLMLGKITLAPDAKLNFPNISDAPGLYRFRYTLKDKAQIFIGESENLKRRFMLYRNPGPSQQTNVRLNALLKDAILEGAVIEVDIVLASEAIRVGGTTTTADFKNKAIRRMFEHAAIVALHNLDVESANR